MRLPTLFCALLTLPVAAASFELSATGPEFTVTVPGLPDVRLVPQAVAALTVVRLLAGSDGVHQVSIVVTTTRAEVSPRTCAASLLRALVARPGMPDRDSIYRAPLDQDTFLVLYILGSSSPRQFHAHLLSSASAKHCVEFHVSRPERPGEDVDEWRKTFVGSRVRLARQ